MDPGGAVHGHHQKLQARCSCLNALASPLRTELPVPDGLVSGGQANATDAPRDIFDLLCLEMAQNVVFVPCLWERLASVGVPMSLVGALGLSRGETGDRNVEKSGSRSAIPATMGLHKRYSLNDLIVTGLPVLLSVRTRAPSRGGLHALVRKCSVTRVALRTRSTVVVDLSSATTKLPDSSRKSLLRFALPWPQTAFRRPQRPAPRTSCSNLGGVTDLHMCH